MNILAAPSATDYSNQVNTPWTKEILTRFSELFLTGLSASELATALNAEFDQRFSRNAIIGKINRLGLKRDNGYENRPAAPKREKRRYEPRVRTVHAKPVRPAPEIIDQQIPLEQRRTLLQLEAHHCRFGVGDPCAVDFFFCGGAVKEDSAYCPSHHARCHQVPR